jgi:CheY-like chemotaxis protein
LGIGLTVVQGLVQLHGGRITAHSDGLGRGSEFVVWLPALAQDEAMEPPSRILERTTEAAARSTKVMVVEDQETVARITVALLKTMGHEVALAKDAPSALELVQEFRPEIILMDIGLPGMNGYELAAAMREQLGAETPMLVALTGYGQEADRRRAEEAGFDQHVVKPISMARLKEIFSEAVARSH